MHFKWHGKFVWPFCRQVQSCKEKELALYVTFFFVINVSKAATLTSYKKCTVCQKRFPAYAPDWETLDVRTAMEFTLLTCMIRVRLANGGAMFQRRDDPSLELVRQQFLLFAHANVDEYDIMERATFMKKISDNRNGKGIQDDLIPIDTQQLESTQQKVHVLKAMAAVVWAKDKRVYNREAKLFVDVGSILGLDKQTIREFLPEGYNM